MMASMFSGALHRDGCTGERDPAWDDCLGSRVPTTKVADLVKKEAAKADRSTASMTTRFRRRLGARNNTPTPTVKKEEVEVEVSDEHDDPDFEHPDPGGMDTDTDADRGSVPTPSPVGRSPRLLRYLDKGGSSTRTAFRTVASVLSASQTSVTNQKCSHSTLWRNRVRDRAARAREIREAFKANKGKKVLTVHWDGIKLDPLVPTRGRKVEERLPFLVSGPDVSQLLGARAIPSSSGEHTAEEVVRCINEWECAENITALCSDTPTGNTGYNIGAAVRIEEALGKPLLYFACRHHILELIPKGLFDQMVEKSTSPDIGALCKSLQEKWPHMDHSSFTPGTEDPACEKFLREHRDSILSFAMETLEKPHIRADYKQLVQLVIIFMGENPFKPKDIRFSPPIAVSSARFMARIIYCLMIHMFSLSGQFEIGEAQLTNIRRLNLFFVSTYMKPWYTATIPAIAPRIDLELLKNIVNYNECPEVSQIASKVFKNHLWYLHSVTVGIAFFDEGISIDEKKEMVAKLTVPPPKNVSKWKRYVLPANKNLSALKDKTLADFVNKNTEKFFKIMDIKMDFLREDPSEWAGNASYQDGMQKINSLHVVNDIAERGVALVKRFIEKPLTRKEEWFQELLLVQNDLLSQEKHKTDTLTLAQFE
ncbi:2,3-dihydroxyphenylpropionate/2,3-dihydroxicinnamic acid 1,2-dioxygenase [Frankliniella fusca]|uniref:2,3-dihydroxyphenylpropionate/2, 3-dihydroxicinnamic acid 1,2-dioxygenase n=1 Tax=Frankliniella fusca TaxID=407009 RepID=A0AAE1GUS2_9NEOP|nr:2,3-dihydroxyphenylpropionate/2,3-dihydroxicinnamic acid 1,2-dioxygenase [Frankliniella fusca]